MVSKIQKNENLAKLRELSELLCNNDFNAELSDDKYKKILNEIRSIIEMGDESVLNEKSRYQKLKCYETMHSKIKIILGKLKKS